jgi:WD40 repeat protein/serine/threonine protein kinase
MGVLSVFDAGFQSSLPLPLARLYTRAHHAKGERERHDHAFHLVEAALKLAAAALVGRYRGSGKRSERVEASLRHLARASPGHWVSIFREALTFLAGEKDPWACRILAHLEPPAPATAEIQYLLAKPVGPTHGADTSGSLFDLLDLLPAYRNAMSGAHGSIKSDPAMYRENMPALLEMARALLAANALLGGGRLMYAEDVRVGLQGETRVVWMALAGLAAIRCQPYEGEISSEAILPGKLHWEVAAGEHIPLYPLLHYRPGEVLDQVFFLNRARNGSQGIQFLCYTTGEFYVPGDDSLGAHLVGQLSEMVSPPPRGPGRTEADESPPEREEGPSGKRFGDFEIEGRIGQGSMAVVYRARQRSLDRTVALKTLPREMEDDPVTLSRFKQEVRALARCDHPNVVKVLSAGRVNGIHCYAMEFIDGCDLAMVSRELVERQHVTPTPLEAQHFDLAASDAHRHGAGSPERGSLPAGPGNRGRAPSRPLAFRVAEVMRDAAWGVQHIHDQGIIHRDLKPQNIMITQQEHRPVIMDLGLAKLIEASRSLSRDGQSLLGTMRYMPPEQLQRSLLEVDARADVYALGAVTYELACQRPMLDGDTEERLTAQILFEEPVPPQTANPEVPADLATIIAKATRKDPRERYPSAAALADDLDSFVSGRPIVARPPTLGYLLKLFVQRNPASVAATVAAILLIAGLLAGWMVSLRQAWHDERQARLEKADASRRLRGLYLSAEAKGLATSDPDLAAILAVEGAGYQRTALNSNALLAVLENLQQVKVLAGHTRELSCAAFDGEGRRVVTAAWDCTARIWNAETGNELAVLEHDDRVTWADFSPDGKLVVTSSVDGTAPIWDSETGARLRILTGHTDKVTGVHFNHDGDQVLTTSWDRTARLWNPRTGKTTAILDDHQDRVHDGSFSQDGRLAATVSADGMIRIWDAATGRKLRQFAGNGSKMQSIAFSPDAERLVTTSLDWTAHIWNAATGENIHVLRGHEDATYSAEFSPDGRRVLTASWDKTARIWDAATGKERMVLRGHADKVNAAAFSSCGDRVVTASKDFTAGIWSTTSWRDTTTLKGHKDEVWSTAFGPGSRLITGSDDATARVWNLETRQELLCLPHEDNVSSARFSPDGQYVATSSGKLAHVWDVRTRERRVLLDGHDDIVNSVEFSPDGQYLVTASYDGTARIWDSWTGELIHTLSGHNQRVHHAGFSPDGKQVVSCGRDRTVRLWEARNGKRIATFSGHQADVYAVEFSRDGKHIISASGDRTARLWDASGTEIRVFSGHTDAVYCATFSPDGRLAATCSKDRTARLWDLENGREIGAFEGHEREVTCAAFRPDGQRLVTVSADGTARIWPVDPLPEVDARRPRAPTPAEREYYEIGTPEERRGHWRRWRAAMIAQDVRILTGILSRGEKPHIRQDLLYTIDRLITLVFGATPAPAALRSAPDLLERIRRAVRTDPELAALEGAIDSLERLDQRILLEP